jgi:hypothetical protein
MTGRGTPSVQVTEAEARWHMVCGLHSRIPACCILYFLTAWQEKSEAMRARRMRRLVGFGPACGRPPPRNKQYVPCPACVRAKRFVRVHLCTRRCVGKPGVSPSVDGRELRALRRSALRRSRARV